MCYLLILLVLLVLATFHAAGQLIDLFDLVPHLF